MIKKRGKNTKNFGKACRSCEAIDYVIRGEEHEFEELIKEGKMEATNENNKLNFDKV